MSVSPLILNVSRTSLHDGRGIRTVVYFKGCNMRCQWCHNPEGQEYGKEIIRNQSKCISCGACVSVCPNISPDMSIRRDLCVRCGKCAAACPTGAISVAGEQKSVNEIMDIILKDKEYYDISGGGVTLSGGECMLFPDFAKKLLKECKAKNIDTVIESAFNVPWSNIEAVLPYVDTFFVDIKHMDSEIHEKYTGSKNDLILENIKKLAALTKNILIRIPAIPGVNDSEENLNSTKEFASSLGLKTEILKYNNLARSKYLSLGREYITFGEE